MFLVCFFVLNILTHGYIFAIFLARNYHRHRRRRHHCYKSICTRTEQLQFLLPRVRLTEYISRHGTFGFPTGLFRMHTEKYS